jgi:predicted P-loop ATPase
MTAIAQAIASFFNHHFPLIPGSKKPLIPNWQHSPASENHTTHHGIALQPLELVLDFDCKYYPADPMGPGKLKLEAEIIKEWGLPGTRVVKTPSGGRHLYYSISEGKPIAFEQPFYGAMINFLTKGRYVAGAGSVTSEGVYELECDQPIAQLPEAFYNWLQKVPDKLSERAAVDAIEVDDGRALIQYESYLKVKAPPANSGEGGDHTTLVVAMVGRDFGLTMETTQKLMWEHYNRRCDPPWFESELDRKVQNAYRYAKGKQGSRSPVRLVDKDPLLQAAAPVESKAVKEMKALRFHHLASDYVLNDKHALVPNNITNARLTLAVDEHFKDFFWWDSFRNCVKLNQQAWWRDDKSNEVSAQDLLHVWDWMVGSAKYPCELGTVKHAVILRSQQETRHPLQAYLNGLKWDGIPRLETLLIDTCDSPDGVWSGRAIRKFLIGCVARAYEPGCKMDYILVLQGNQGIRKGMWIDKLGEPWARCGALDPGDKDLDHKMLGTWIMELPEIDQGHINRDKSKIKDFITRTVDFYRKPYAPAPTDVKRTACFIGTLNPKELGWLEDETGHRRYWPVTVRECDPDRLAAIKDQVFAEAVHYHKQGELPYFTDPADIAMALKAQLSNCLTSDWSEILSVLLADRNEVNTMQCYALLGVSAKEIGGSTRKKLYQALRELKFTYESDKSAWTRQPIP